MLGGWNRKKRQKKTNEWNKTKSTKIPPIQEMGVVFWCGLVWFGLVWWEVFNKSSKGRRRTGERRHSHNTHTSNLGGGIKEKRRRLADWHHSLRHTVNCD